VFWVISVYFTIRNTLLKSGTFLLGHPVYMNLTLREGYWITFCMKFMAIISHDNYQSVLLAFFVNWYNNKLLPFIWQFYIIANRRNISPLA
jgi:hypothetical protein